MTGARFLLMDTMTGAIVDVPTVVAGVDHRGSRARSLGIRPDLLVLLGLLVQDLRVIDIAAELGLSERSVYRRQAELFRALGVCSRHAAVRLVDVVDVAGMAKGP